MEFNIVSHENVAPGAIRLSLRLRRELGILPGQFLKLGSKKEIIVQVGDEIALTEELVGQVHPETLSKLDEKPEIKILDVTLGCDPEFFIIWRGHSITAAAYLPFNGAVGSDGNLGELRPMYATHEKQVVSNLSTLIGQIVLKMKRASWANGLPSDPRQLSLEAHSHYRRLAAGFHVHLGIPPEILNTRQTFNRVAMEHLVSCLDWYLSVPLIPLETDHARRTGQFKYGRPGDYRSSHRTLEYRVPGGFYLRHPELTGGLLGIALLVIENAVSKMKAVSRNFTRLDKLTPKDMQEIMPTPSKEVIQRTLLDTNLLPAQRALEGIRENLEKLPSYRKHEEAIREFLRRVDGQEVPSANLLSNWRR